MNDVIIGKWIYKNGEIRSDKNCQVIQSMIDNELHEIGSSEDGWTKTYESKEGVIWELTFPESHLQGGGPPKLTRL